MRACAVLLLLATGVRLFAQQDATELIRQVVSNFKTATSYHFESATETEMTSELSRSWSKSRLTVAKDQQGRVRFETVASIGAFTVVFDGRTLWIASGDTREFVRTSWNGPLSEAKGDGPVAAQALRQMMFMMTSMERLQEHVTKAERIGEETLEVGGLAVECVVVRADYTLPGFGTGITSLTRTLWIDKQRGVVLREDTFTRGKLAPSRPFDEMEQRHRTYYAVASINQPVANSLFAYTPPRNFRETDKLVPAFPRTERDLIGKPAPELTLPNLAGATVNLSDFKGKILLLDFWATWCAPCRSQMPSIAKLYSETKDQGVVVVGVNDDKTPEKAVEYLKEQGYEWINLHDGLSNVARTKYKIYGIPTLVLIDRQGIIAEYQTGHNTDVDAAIRAALKKLGIRLR